MSSRFGIKMLSSTYIELHKLVELIIIKEVIKDKLHYFLNIHRPHRIDYEKK